MVTWINYMQVLVLTGTSVLVGAVFLFVAVVCMAITVVVPKRFQRAKMRTCWGLLALWAAYAIYAGVHSLGPG